MPRSKRDPDNLPKAQVFAEGELVVAIIDCCSEQRAVNAVTHGVRFAEETVSVFLLDHKCEV